MGKKESLQTTPRLVKEVPAGYKEEIRNGKKVYVLKKETPIPKAPIPVKPNPTKTKPSGTPKRLPPPTPIPVPPDVKSEEDVVYLDEPTPKETVLKSSVQTYGNLLPKQTANQTWDTREFADPTGNTTNKALRANFEGNKEITFDDKGNKIYTGKTLEDFRNNSIQQIETPMMSGVNKPNPNKIQEFSEQGITFDKNASGGIGVNKSTLGTNLKGATDTYIPKRYDSLGKEILTPNTGLKPLGTGALNTKEVGKMYDTDKPVEIKGKFAKGGLVGKIKGYYDGGGVYDPNKNIDGTYGDGVSSYKPTDTFGSGVVGQNDQYTAQNNTEAQKAKDEEQKKLNQQKARNIANGLGEGMGGIGSAYYNSQPTQNEGEATRNAGLAVTSQMGPVGGMISGISAIADKVAKPIKARKESMDSSGNLNNESDARTTAIGASFLSPSKALATRSSYAGGWTDISGKGYTKSLEDKAKKQLQEVKNANQTSRQQQAILARDANNENPTITNPYNLTGATFDENQNLVLANNQQYDPNRVFNKGGLVSKVKKYADGGEIKGKGGPKDDKIKAEVEEGSFVVPAENAELAKGIRKLYLKAPNKKANLKQEEGEPVKLSNGEHLFTPEENEYLESIGIELEDLAPNAEEGNKKQDGGKVKPTKEEIDRNKKWVSDYSSSIMKSGMQDDMINDSKKGLNKYGIISKYEAHPVSDDVKYSNDNVDKLRNGLKAYDEKVKGYALGGEVSSEDEVDPIKELARLNKEKEDAVKAGKVESDAAKAARDKKIADFNAKVESYDRKADRKSKLASWEKKYNDSKTKLDALNKSYEEASKSFEAANTPTAAQKAKGIKVGTLTESQRQYKESLLKKIQEAKSEFDNADRTYKYVKDDNNYDASGNIKTKSKTATVAPKTEVKPTVVTENVAPTKPSLKAPKVAPKSEVGKFVPTLTPDTGEEVVVPGDKLSPNERAIANADAEKATVQAAALNKSLPQTVATNGTPQNQRRGLADVIGSVDPTAFVGIGQAALGLNMLGKEKRPIDNAKIDPTYNAAVNRAQQDARFGLTPEQKFMAEQEIQGGLNDAKFAGLNSSGVQSFNLNRAAINDAWKNKLGLRQADTEMRMNKQKYADAMASDRANVLASNRRQAFNDAMNAFQQKQQAGSELIGAGLANTIGAYRFKKDQEARQKADEARGYSLNNYNPSV